MIIAGTGHRPDKLGGYSDGAFIVLRDIAREWLAVHPEVTEVISAMALGWDQALAAAALLEHRKLHAAVPFAGQESKWPASSHAQYRYLLSRCDTVTICSDGGYSARAMQLRNIWMVCRAEHLLTVWDGSLGGTFNCLQYAKSVGKDHTNLYSRWFADPGNLTRVQLQPA